MAPLPKRKHSLRRARVRGLGKRLSTTNLIPCVSCNKQIYPHRVCPYCGSYAGKVVLTPKREKPKHEEEK